MQFHILHLDDQPEYVSWIPGSLFRYIRRKIGKHSTYKDGDPDSEKLKAQFDIAFNANGKPASLLYELVYNKDDFRSRFKELGDENRVIAIFDLHIGEDITAGVDLVEELFKGAKPDDAEQWIFLTAFAAEAEELLDDRELKSQGSVVAKPPNTTDFIAVLGQALERKLGVSNDES